MVIRDMPGQFPGSQIRAFQRDFHDSVPDGVRYPVPVTAVSAALILKTGQAILFIRGIPAIEAATADFDLSECPAHRQLGLLHQTDDGQFL